MRTIRRVSWVEGTKARRWFPALVVAIVVVVVAITVETPQEGSLTTSTAALLSNQEQLSSMPGVIFDSSGCRYDGSGPFAPDRSNLGRVAFSNATTDPALFLLVGADNRDQAEELSGFYSTGIPGRQLVPSGAEIQGRHTAAPGETSSITIQVHEGWHVFVCIPTGNGPAVPPPSLTDPVEFVLPPQLGAGNNQG